MKFHIPVLLQETLEGLKVKKGAVYIDATLGHGGHASKILNLGGKVYGLDQDEKSLKITKKRLEACPPSAAHGRRRSQGAFVPILGNFKNLKKISLKHKMPALDGIFFDLGLNSSQISAQGEGFSFTDQKSLDMRLDKKSNLPTAKEVLNTFPEQEISHILSSLVQETNAQKIARLIVKNRPLQSAHQLSDLIERKIPKIGKRHPATKTFLALKIYVNQEFENLKSVFWQATNLLKPGARLCFISFHSGEDRLVKLNGRQAVSQNLLKNIRPYPIRPKKEEIQKNPLSRSAILRVFEKT